MKLNCKVGDRIWIDGEPFFVYETYENGNVLVGSINCYSEDDPRLKWAQELSSNKFIPEDHDIIVESMDKFYEKLTNEIDVDKLGHSEVPDRYSSNTLL